MTSREEAERAGRQATERRSDGLLFRVISGVVLAALALAFVYAGQAPFAALVLVIAWLMSWEWGRVVRAAGVDTPLLVHGIAVSGAILVAALGVPALALLPLLTGTIIVALLRFGETARLSALGVPYVGLPAVSLIWLRGDESFGLLAVLFVFLCVWTTDTAAYAIGRLVGGPLLWPRISPRKTWAGFTGGVAASGVAGALLAFAIASGSVIPLAVGGVALGLAAQAGDLLESALKRGFGVKDASQLLPGHGGFMDRLDGLVVAATVAAVFGMLVNVRSPAHALLYWS